MKKMITIAVDAMGGDNAPKKIIEGIELHHKTSSDIYYKLFGDQNIINPIIKSKSIDNNIYEIYIIKVDEIETEIVTQFFSKGCYQKIEDDIFIIFKLSKRCFN